MRSRRAPSMVLLDPTMLMLLNGAVPTPAANRPVMMHAGALNMQGPAPAQVIAADQQMRFNAMLMSPIPVLAQMVRKNLEESATAAVQGATNLVDFASTNSIYGGDTGDVPMLDDLPNMEDGAAAASGGSGAMGSTAMVGAAAAALALMNIRAQQ